MKLLLLGVIAVAALSLGSCSENDEVYEADTFPLYDLQAARFIINKGQGYTDNRKPNYYDDDDDRPYRRPTYVKYPSYYPRPPTTGDYCERYPWRCDRDRCFTTTTVKIEPTVTLYKLTSTVGSTVTESCSVGRSFATAVVPGSFE